VAGVAVAAAIAIAVPVGLTMTGSAQRSVVDPASPSPAPVVTGTVTIEPRTTPVGDPTTVTLIDVTAPSVSVAGETTALPDDPFYDQVVTYLDGWIAVANNEGVLTYQQLSADLEVLDQVSPVSPLTVSQDRSRIAFATYDGDHWSVSDLDAAGARPERLTPFPSGPQDASVRTVGFLPDDGLLVAQTDPTTGRESAIMVSPDGTTTPLDGFLKPVSSSAATGMVAGQVSATGDGSCWRVTDAASGTVAWETCDHSLGELSPDGQHLAGFAAYLDGDGSPTMSILDAATGASVVDFEIAGGRRGLTTFNPEVAWEDDSHLVTTAISSGVQYVVRLGLDGTVERIATDAADPTLNPIRVLP
jgi:hypothetical protein